jgi:N-acylneuraminate cytidylyltransferase
MNICIIPARGGSKRIPGKNIKDFNGKPIIAYSIKAAIDSDCFDQIIVSTDNNEIAEVAKHYGAIVPFVRPYKLSNDYTETIPVVRHAIEWLEHNDNVVSYVCCLYATAPFIRPQTILNAYQQLIDTKADYCFSVTKFPFPIQRALKIDNGNKVDMFYPKHYKTRSQDLEESYHDAGQFYWGNAKSFKDELQIFSKSSTPYILPRYLVQDIDTLEDWEMAENMHKSLDITHELS